MTNMTVNTTVATSKYLAKLSLEMLKIELIFRKLRIAYYSNPFKNVQIGKIMIVVFAIIIPVW